MCWRERQRTARPRARCAALLSPCTTVHPPPPRKLHQATKAVAGEGKAVVDTPIYLRVYTSRLPDLTVVDLPGITCVCGCQEGRGRVSSPALVKAAALRLESSRPQPARHLHTHAGATQRRGSPITLRRL